MLQLFDSLDASTGMVKIFQQSCVFKVKASETTTNSANVQQIVKSIIDDICPNSAANMALVQAEYVYAMSVWADENTLTVYLNRHMVQLKHMISNIWIVLQLL